ncbi:MAG: T9SS type A sorting domain-containing protein [Bacteroidetes bacterium]|nr:MAG: T9SS type A sorting domain-containing protein [Bacteroidota bacterium]
MKKFSKLLFISSISVIGVSNAQENLNSGEVQQFVNSLGQKVKVFEPSSFRISQPVLELASDDVNKAIHLVQKKHVFKNNLRQNKVVNEQSLPNGDDPLWQKNQGNRISRSPLVNVDGLPGGGGIPLDPSGAAGTSHYVQAINTEYRIFNKDGSGLVGAMNLSSLWPGSQDSGDPIVLYDKHADRWFVSQFQSESPYKLLVAVSKTNDPTGSYYTYSYDFTELPDYPKYAIWSDGYYFSINGTDGTSGVMDRTKMLAGDPGATMQILTASNVSNNGFTSMLPTDADGSLPPNGSPCYFFNLRDDAWGEGSDAIQVYKMSTDWTTPSNTKIVSDGDISVSAFDAAFPEGGVPPNEYPHISQKGTDYKLDAVAGVLYYRAQHRVWTGYNSVVLCHVVDVNGNDRAGMRWYELRQNETTSKWGVYQEGTYAPTSDTDNRWLGSISMDDQGNIAMAYSVSGPNTFPSIRYTGRRAADPLGQMTFSEEEAMTGAGSQTDQTAGDRYGDYSHLALDPDGETFWHTAEYVHSDGFPRTRIYSFKLTDISAGIQENTLYDQLETSLKNVEGNLSIEVKGLFNDEQLSLDLFDTQGKRMQGFDVKPDNQEFKAVMNVQHLPTGVYLLRYGNVRFQKVIKVQLNQ